MTRIFFMARKAVRPVPRAVEPPWIEFAAELLRDHLRRSWISATNQRNGSQTNAMTSLHETLREILTSKAYELFADYSVVCAADGSELVDRRLLCGILGFTGDRLCGSVVLSATEDAIACSNPIGDGATRGWVAELTNQLVGRFKNELFRRGVEVAMSIPVVLTATQLTPLPQTHLDPTRLVVGTGSVTIWLEIEAEAGLELSEPSADTAMAAEGEAMLF
jgi:CheY-specific phosphatase CheX